ncbi:MAG: hypothetical protein WC697_01190 [Patescibacteria group bacterium]|jgi:hypothetical protein
MLIEEKIYDLYKPLRNHLRPVSIENAFYVIWAYINFLQFNKIFPKDIQVDSAILNKDSHCRYIAEWELALLTREMIVNGQISPSLLERDFRNYSYFAGAINKIKDFENEAWSVFGNISNVPKEIRRTAHRQFPWQSKPNPSLFVRYFKIYNNPRINQMVENIIGLSVQQWYMIGTALIGVILSNPKIYKDPKISIPGISKKEFDTFLSFTAADLDKLGGIIEKDVKYDDQYVYTLNPLEYYPLININQYYYCPIITFLIWRITSGIYFDLIGNKNFGDPFGFAFQDYLEEISNKILLPSVTKIFPEQKYSGDKGNKDSVDFILSQTEAAIFLEAKAKRMIARSKSQLLSNEAIEKDLDILADDIVKVYATIYDYKMSRYLHFPYQPSIKVYPLIVTMEDWFLFGEDSKKLSEKVECKLQNRGLDINYLTEIPYTVCSATNYEYFIQILNNHTINEVMNKWFTPDKKDHNFGQFLLSNYNEGYKEIDYFFPNDFEKIYQINN